MFAYIEGRVTEKYADAMVVEAGGVGFLVSATPQTISSVSGSGARCRVYTKVVAKKDDVWEIYGFATREEREMFEKLTSVSGVGPKAALAILSVCTPQGLAMAVITGDEKALIAAPGIGKKIAQRIILELKDKLAKEQQEIGMPTAPGIVAGEKSKAVEAAAALAVLGYTQQDIAVAMKGVDVENLPLEEIVRQSLKKMVK